MSNLSKYRVDTNKRIPIVIYVAVNEDHTRSSVLSLEEYESFVQRYTPNNKDEGTESTDDLNIQFVPSDYTREEAKMVATNAELDALISQESIVNNPILGYYHDPSSVRFAKIKYLLKDWTIDMPLKLVTLFEVEQLDASTVKNIRRSLPTAILAKILQTYDEKVLS